MVFKINGIDILQQYVTMDGLVYTRNDIDGPNAGRTMDGTMHRDRIASKVRWDITCRPLTAEKVAQVLQLIKSEFVTVQFTDPETGTVVTKEMYSNNIPVKLAFYRGEDDTSWWTNFSFPLIER